MGTTESNKPRGGGRTPARGKGRVAAGRIIAMVVAFCIPATLALVLHGSIFGYAPGAAATDAPSPLVRAADSEIINTTGLCSDISGYAGPVPVEIYVTGGRIDSVRALPNSESPGFFAKLKSGGLTDAWNGRTLAEAASMEVDGITGATYSSRAFIANVRAGAAYAEGEKASAPSADGALSVVDLLVIAVILCGAVLPLFVHKPAYRLIQQLLNIGVLGFWGGTFIDYAMMIGFFAVRPHMSVAFVITVLLLIVGFIYPAFGKPGHYCAWVCPFGSLQELAGKVCRRKIKLPAALVKWLDGFRQLLWCVLLFLLYAGLATGWVDYEIFTAFIVRSASWIVIAAGGLFVVLSLFINRPFCRFVCPTGTLLKDA